MDRTQSKKNIVFNSLTILSAFLMGFIDAYTFLEQNGSFASAQTGNLVTLSVKIFLGEFNEIKSHILVFGGFLLGAFIGELLLKKFKGREMYKTWLILLIQVILFGLLALLQNELTDSMMIFTLGLLAGYELTVFRKFRGTTVNNGIMTGNTKNMMTNFYQMIFERDKQVIKNFFNFFTIIIVFLLGAGMGALIIKWNVTLNLWFAFILVLISLILMSRVRFMTDE